MLLGLWAKSPSTPTAARAGSLAHHKAIGSIDGKGVTSLGNYIAVNTAIGHTIASAREAKTMAVHHFGRPKPFWLRAGRSVEIDLP
eukprot:5734600-Heterocapsa_arctica.AAC.1